MKTSPRYLFAPLSLAAALLGVSAPASASCIDPLSDAVAVGQASAPALQLPAGWSAPVRVKDVDVDNAHTLAGLWKFTQVDSLGNLMDFGFKTVNDSGPVGGTEYQLSFGHPPINGNSCVGVWRRSATAGHYKGSHFVPLYADDHVTFLGTAHRVDEITLSADGQTASGSFVSTGYDVNGNILFVRTGQISATRVKVNATFP